MSDEEDDLDKYMKSLEVPADFLAAQTKPAPQSITLEELEAQAKKGGLANEQQHGSEDKFFQALLSAEPKPDNNKTSKEGEVEQPGADGEDGLLESESEPLDGIAVAKEIIAAKAKRKEIKPVDHSKIDYPPFRKNFYVESPDVAAMTDKQLKEIKEELEITIRGKNPPKPISSWEECGLSLKLLETLLANGWTKPFAIQRQALPAIMSGRDVMGIAQTGSGKTLAYLIPLLRHVKDQPPVTQGQGPVALIIVPARELATQIQREVHKFKKSLGVDCACLYGGQNLGEQIKDLKKGVPVVVGTPGRLIDILSTQGGRQLPLNRVTLVVLDEADRLFDMGFTPQVERILQNVRPDRQTVMFSATFPHHVEKLAKEALKQPLHIVIGNARSGAKVSADVTQIIELWPEDQKFLRVLQLLGEWYTKGNILIFCDSQVRVDSLYQELERAGYPAVTLHAGKDQLDRDHAIKDFKSKTRTLMVATGVAGRGLDVPDLNLVINFNCPNHLEEYVHRVGRTGRAGRKGTAITFVIDPDDQKYASDLIFALKASEQPVPDFLKRMAEEFDAKIAAGVEKKHQSGYKTKGFAFDEEEDANKGGYQSQLKRMRNALYEEIRGAKEDGMDVDGLDDERTPLEPSPPAPSVSPQPAVSPAVPPSAPPPVVQSSQPVMANPINAEVERIKAEEIAKAKSLALASGLTPAPPTAPVSVSRAPPKTQGFTSAKEYGHHEIVINDLPPHVLKKVMIKPFQVQIENEFKVSLTVKGRLFPPGQKREKDDIPLTLMIDSTNANNVRMAVAELNRHIENEVRGLSESQAYSHLIGANPNKYKL